MNWERSLHPRLGSIIAMVVLAYFAGWLAKYGLWHQADVQRDYWQQQYQQQQQALTDARQQLSTSKLDLSIEKQTLKQMQVDFNTLQGRLTKVTEELDFYRSVMAPEMAAEGVYASDMEIRSGALPNKYDFRLVLAQLKKRKTSVRGVVDVTFFGVQNGKTQRFRLSDMAVNDINKQFNFQYFQFITGSYVLPEGFEPQRVEVVVRVSARGSTKAATTTAKFDYQEVLIGAEDGQAILEQDTRVIDNPAKPNVVEND
ncbi:DUF6776 family protein [Paraferrimonas haliotis]|nr:DUF6776 family protein [Paraferrimonas haliotis]